MQSAILLLLLAGAALQLFALPAGQWESINKLPTALVARSEAPANATSSGQGSVNQTTTTWTTTTSSTTTVTTTTTSKTSTSTKWIATYWNSTTTSPPESPRFNATTAAFPPIWTCPTGGRWSICVPRPASVNSTSAPTRISTMSSLQVTSAASTNAGLSGHGPASFNIPTPPPTAIPTLKTPPAPPAEVIGRVSEPGMKVTPTPPPVAATEASAASFNPPPPAGPAPHRPLLTSPNYEAFAKMHKTANQQARNYQNVPTPSGDFLTIQVQNSMNESMGIFFITGKNFTAPIRNLTSGFIAANSTSRIFVPLGWGGQMTFNKENHTHPAATKIEGNYKTGDSKAYIDVSYVDGYTFPATAYIIPKDAVELVPDVMSGCNKALFDLNACDVVQQGVCINDAREKHERYASPFFLPCAGAAYTFPKDDTAGSGRDTKVVHVCVGHGCLANPHQTL